MIQVRNLTKRYGAKLAVDNVSFDIEKGKIYGFLGPNGAGKSTTMNILTGCISATSGSISVNGCDIFKNPIAAKRSIGYLPEIPPLYPDMTPLEFLTFVAEAKGVGAEDTYLQVKHVMALTSLDGVADRLIGNLSKGYQQRVGIAQALLGDPEVIILDEPTVGLDPKQIIEIRDLIRELGKTKTVILSSHILAEISAVCDHIMILSDGKLVANDTPIGLEESMNANDKMTLTVKCGKEDAIRILETVENIESYAVLSEDEGSTHLTVCTKKNADIREAVFLAFAEARLPILHMAIDRMTLEDIFLQLTSPAIVEETFIIEAEDEKSNEEDTVLDESETKEEEDDE